MKYKATELISVMQETGLVPLFSHEDPVIAQEIVEAVYRGGARVLEFTNRKANAFEVFSHIVKNRNRYPEMLLGVGTVLDGATTEMFIDAGSDFIVSPIMRPEMANVCEINSTPWVPGCGTLTEIVNARDLGAAVIKVFPGSVLGPGFISSILPVVPDLKLMITGGVEFQESNISAWFKSGALCVGLGSHLFAPRIIEDKNWQDLESKVKHGLEIIKKVKR